jgi:hypothetical protein
VHVVASRCIARSSSGAPRGALRSGHDACRNGAQRALRTQDDATGFTPSVHWVKSHEHRRARERFFAILRAARTCVPPPPPRPPHQPQTPVNAPFTSPPSVRKKFNHPSAWQHMCPVRVSTLKHVLWVPEASNLLACTCAELASRLQAHRLHAWTAKKSPPTTSKPSRLTSMTLARCTCRLWPSLHRLASSDTVRRCASSGWGGGQGVLQFLQSHFCCVDKNKQPN